MGNYEEVYEKGHSRSNRPNQKPEPLEGKSKHDSHNELTHLDGHPDEHLDVEFIMVMVHFSPPKEAFKHRDKHLDVHPDVHLDVQFIKVIAIGLLSPCTPAEARP